MSDDAADYDLRLHLATICHRGNRGTAGASDAGFRAFLRAFPNPSLWPRLLGHCLLTGEWHLHDAQGQRITASGMPGGQ
jgi:hypothetical protein